MVIVVTSISKSIYQLNRQPNVVLMIIGAKLGYILMLCLSLTGVPAGNWVGYASIERRLRQQISKLCIVTVSNSTCASLTPVSEFKSEVESTPA